jgi:hypothetical protein
VIIEGGDIDRQPSVLAQHLSYLLVDCHRSS